MLFNYFWLLCFSKSLLCLFHCWVIQTAAWLISYAIKRILNSHFTEGTARLTWFYSVIKVKKQESCWNFIENQKWNHGNQGSWIWNRKLQRDSSQNNIECGFRFLKKIQWNLFKYHKENDWCVNSCSYNDRISRRLFSFLKKSNFLKLKRRLLYFFNKTAF